MLNLLHLKCSEDCKLNLLTVGKLNTEVNKITVGKLNNKLKNKFQSGEKISMLR
jgi:hypothetical protein